MHNKHKRIRQIKKNKANKATQNKICIEIAKAYNSVAEKNRVQAKNNICES